MKAIVLVGGEGTRLRPLTYTTPKQLLPVVEVPMLERVVGHLAAHGVDEVVLSMGYRPDAFRARYPDGRAAGVELHYAVEPELLDTAGAVRFAAESAKLTESFLVVNGDVLTDIDITSLVAFHRDVGAAGTIALTPVEDPSRFGVVPTDETGRVQAFVEKPPPGESPTNLVNAGTYVLEPEILDDIPAGRRVSIERETFPQLVAAGTLFARRCDGYWLDTGTPEAYLKAHADLLGGLRGPSPAPGARQIAQEVWTLGTPEIGGTLGPRTLIGDGATVEAGAEVSGSVVGAGARVEGGAAVEDAVLLPGATVAEGAIVRRSVIGHRSVVSANAHVEPVTVVGDDVTVAPGSELRDARVPAGAPAGH
ncbi:MAG: sugar phosphate nucleotidyltransferase [Acidimicrobiales bacterium]